MAGRRHCTGPQLTAPQHLPEGKPVAPIMFLGGGLPGAKHRSLSWKIGAEGSIHSSGTTRTTSLHSGAPGPEVGDLLLQRRRLGLPRRGGVGVQLGHGRRCSLARIFQRCRLALELADRRLERGQRLDLAGQLALCLLRRGGLALDLGTQLPQLLCFRACLGFQAGQRPRGGGGGPALDLGRRLL